MTENLLFVYTIANTELIRALHDHGKSFDTSGIIQAIFAYKRRPFSAPVSVPILDSLDEFLTARGLTPADVDVTKVIVTSSELAGGIDIAVRLRVKEGVKG